MTSWELVNYSPDHFEATGGGKLNRVHLVKVRIFNVKVWLLNWGAIAGTISGLNVILRKNWTMNWTEMKK